ncbi:hypothetical protein CkaCkLH20_08979 [Colletotrichum karsti]|uniref:Uncharacterized protein n=1 Tax=Colletotrichum karsti TaxID=1095194 RepID=A0A9P6I7N3_9PEZI|nr:uncharacterized protein CkaCkLH20_08979 [Colletotrichum karsti]KAF9873520.1 hypothetical protein CkaCkLH20_08979 [Colletotrichum karsti]
MNSIVPDVGSALSDNGDQKPADQSIAHPAPPPNRPSAHALTHIPGPVVAGFHRLGPRKDHIAVQIIDIMRPFRLLDSNPEEIPLSKPRRTSKEADLVGIATYSATGSETQDWDIHVASKPCNISLHAADANIPSAAVCGEELCNRYYRLRANIEMVDEQLRDFAITIGPGNAGYSIDLAGVGSQFNGASGSHGEPVVRPVVLNPQIETTTTTPLQSFLSDRSAGVGSTARHQERQDAIKGVIDRVNQLLPNLDGNGVPNNQPQQSASTDLKGIGSQFSNK